MMTTEELQKVKINPEIAREILTQTEKCLADHLATKDALEKKATALLSVFITLTLAMYGAAIALIHSINPFLSVPFFVTATILIIGDIFFALSLKGEEYGIMGSDPSAWLRRGYVDGAETAHSAMLIYLASFYQPHIDASYKSNIKKEGHLSKGIWLGILSVIILGIGLVITVAHTPFFMGPGPLLGGGGGLLAGSCMYSSLYY